MKKIFLTIILGISLFACSQENKHSNTSIIKTETKMNFDQYIPTEAKNITEANFVEKVSSQIKQYDKEPIYYFRINKQNCLIEVSINDVKDYDDYELSNVLTPIKIGHILKTGLQTVTVKMFPVGDLINKDLGLENQAPATKLSDKAKVDISVVMMDNKSKKSLDDEKVITTQASPKDIAGKQHYEFSFTFNADVPYEFEGWTKGQDLRKLDKELVEKKALEFYKMIGAVYNTKDIATMLKLEYLFTCRVKQSFYRNKADIEGTLEQYVKDVKNSGYKMKISENYTVNYQGNGKLLRLTNNSLDPDYRGGGALCLENDEGYYYPGITLYLPEGRDLATQGFLMWK